MIQEWMKVCKQVTRLCFGAAFGILCGCNGERGIEETAREHINEQVNKLSDHIILKASSRPGDDVFAYYFDEYDNLKNIAFKRDSLTGKLKDVLIPSEYPLLITFSRGFAQYPVFIMPGEAVTVRSFPDAPTKFIFEGERSAELNFFTFLEKESLGIGLVDTWGIDMRTNLERKGKRFSDLLYMRMQLLDTASDSLGFSREFYEFARAEIIGRYLNAMATPYYLKNVDLTTIPKPFTDSLKAVMTKGWFAEQGAIRSSYMFRMGVNDYLRYLAGASSGSSHGLQELYTQASTKLQGNLRDYVWFSLIDKHMDKGISEFEKYLERYMLECTSPRYREYVSNRVLQRDAFSFDEATLSTSLLSMDGQKLTWGEVLEKNRGRLLYLDFWASWCAPCIAEMPASKELLHHFERKDITFINISIDTKSRNWAAAVQKHGLDGAAYQNYLLAPDAVLAKLVKAPPIPRYIILNREGKVLAFNAKRPSDKDLRGELERLLSLSN